VIASIRLQQGLPAPALPENYTPFMSINLTAVTWSTDSVVGLTGDFEQVRRGGDWTQSLRYHSVVSVADRFGLFAGIRCCSQHIRFFLVTPRFWRCVLPNGRNSRIAVTPPDNESSAHGKKWYHHLFPWVSDHPRTHKQSSSIHQNW